MRIETLCATTAISLGLVFSTPFVLDGGHAWAADDCTPGTVVLYVNGIRTNAEGSAADRRHLEATVAVTQRSDGKPVRYLNFYNPTNGAAGDLLESFIQRIDQEPILQFLRPYAQPIIATALSGYVNLELQFIRTLFPSQYTDQVTDRLSAILNEIGAQYLSASTRVAETGAQLQSQIQTFVDQGQRVIVVAHSQGNFVANQAIGQLSSTARQSVVMVSAATPASSVAGASGPYAKLERDIINIIPGSLRFNISQNILQFCRGNPLINHSFIDCYLGSDNSAITAARDQVVNSVKAQINGTQPQSIVGFGQIVATLTWGAQPDVDLHAFEPNGAHVYYGNTSGPMGTLDRDDVTSFGPENYKVCKANDADIQTGGYRIGVNYFSGSAPETATIKVKAGALTRTFTIPLSAARGGAGDSSPIPVSTVTVTRAQNNVLQYQIQ